MKQKDSLNKRLNTRLASLVMLSVLSVPWVAGAAATALLPTICFPVMGNKVT